MPAKVDVKKMLENRFAKMDAQLDNLEPGSAQYSLLTNNMCKIAEKLTNLKQAEDQAEDNTAKREEAKRVNDEELRIKGEELIVKQTQVENERDRIQNENEMRKKQMTGNLLIDAGRMLCAWAGMAAYERRYQRVMGMEYALSDGTNVTPPNGVKRILDEGKPRNNF